MTGNNGYHVCWTKPAQQRKRWFVLHFRPRLVSPNRHLFTGTSEKEESSYVNISISNNLFGVVAYRVITFGKPPRVFLVCSTDSKQRQATKSSRSHLQELINGRDVCGSQTPRCLLSSAPIMHTVPPIPAPTKDYLLQISQQRLSTQRIADAATLSISPSQLTKLK